MHDLIIGVLIIAIVAIQLYIFSITLKKIKIFKNVLPSQENFKIVKVFIKENEIETISLVDIFKNLPENTNLGNKMSKNSNIKDSVQNLQQNEQLKVNFEDEIDTSEMLFEIEADKTSLVINQVLNLKFNINEDGDNFTPQPFDGFSLIKGPIQEVSQAWLDGTGTFFKSYSYMLKPIKTGVLVINKATIEFDGKIHQSNSLTINVKEY